MKFCAACSMPLESEELIGKREKENYFCIHCVDENGEVKSCEEVFKECVDFFISQFPDMDKEVAERITRKNMSTLNYWKKDNSDCLIGDVSTDEEFNEILSKLK